MFRFFLFLLLAAAVSLPAVAREVKRSTANGASCPLASATKSPAKAESPTMAPDDQAAPAPTVHSDAASNGRLQSPRWRSFLPGMFR